MTSSDDWIAAFGSTFTGGSPAAASATSGLTVISSGSSQPSLSSSRSVSLVSSGEYGGVAKRAHLFCYDPAVSYCLGFVGVGGKRFCIKPVLPFDAATGVRPTTCGVGKHVSKFGPDPDFLYLRGNDATAYCLPAFSQHSLPPEILVDVKSMTKTNQEWKELFAKYQDPDQPQGLTDLGVAKLALKTPKKARSAAVPDLPSVYVPDGLKEISMQADILAEEYHWWTTNDDDSLLPGSLMQFLRDAREFLANYEQWLVEPHEVASSRLALVEDDIHQMKNFCDGISGNLGRPISFQDMDFPDAWCAIEYIGSMISSSTSMAEMQRIKGSIDQMQQDFSRILPIADGWHDHTRAMEAVRTSVKTLEAEVSTHTSRFTFMQPILLQIGTITANLTVLTAKVDALQPSLTGSAPPVSDPWQRQFNSTRSHSSVAPLPDHPLGLIPNDPNGSAVPDISARLNTLEHALKTLEQRTMGDGTKIGRFVFQSKEDLRMWMVTHVPNNRFGMFLDAVSIFDFLAQSHLDAQENMSQLYNSQKNGFETTYESRIVSSMQNLFPNLFGKTAADGMDTSKALPGLQSVEKWNNNGVTGLYFQVERELPNVDLQFRNAISATFDSYPEARDLALELLYRSKKFALDLCNFIQRDFDFWRHKRYKDTEAWELTCLSVR